MSVENPETINGTGMVTKSLNGEQQQLNGLSNGHFEGDPTNHVSSSKHKSSSKDKHRDRERGDHKSSRSSTNHNKDSDRHKHHSSSSKDKHRDKDKHKSSSHKSSRDKDRDKDKDKDRNKEHRSSDKSKDKHRDKDKEKSSRDDNVKDGEIGNKDKERKKEHRSSNDKDRKERSDKEKDKKSSSSNHHKSSSHHTSSSHKHSSSSSLKTGSNREKNHSSSSKDKDRHRSDKDRHRSDKNKSKSSSSSSHKRNVEIKQENGQDQLDNAKLIAMKELKVELEILPDNYNEQTCTGYGSTNNSIKEEKQSPMKLNNSHRIKEESFINASQASSCDYSMSQFREDEPAFAVAATKVYNESENSENEETINSINDPLGLSVNNNVENDYVDNSGNDDDEDIPLAKRKAQVIDEYSDDDIPLVSRKKIKKEEKKSKKKNKKREMFDDDDYDEEYDEKPKTKKIKKEKTTTNFKPTVSINQSPMKGGRKKKEAEETDDVWRWWEEEKREDGVKWNFLEHRGPVFAPLYERLPKNIQFFYDGKPMHLTEDTEEVACFYAKMLNHDYVTKKQFNENFFKDWRKTMTSKEKDIIKDLKRCNFKEMHSYFTAQSEKNKNRSKQEKLALKEGNEALIKEYGFCTIDGHKEKIGNFKLEPPGLFRGRGEHPKMGLVKRRIRPEDVLINCSKNSKIPEPPKGHRWKEVRHDNSVTWLASWIENVQGQVKYIMLNPSSKLKGEKDHQKYEIARKLDKQIEKIRETYRNEWKSKEMRIRQRGVALYFIDKLALRAGNEKDEDQADTVGCCSLRVEHVSLKRKLHDKENVVVFDFLGKDSIRYYNEVEVEKRVFKNLELFMENKKEGDELFDRLNTSILNDHLRDLMDGLTAKVFRTYNASITLQNQLNLLTEPNSTIPEKLLSYNRANRAVAVLCNHQRSVPKSHEKSMENLKEKIRAKQKLIKETEAEYQDLKKQAKRGSVKEKLNADKKLKQLERLQEQLKKLELQETDRDENKTIALGTSKLNYLDPRISVAWCKKHEVPLEKIFNKTQRDKFRWAIHMADENYVF